jgi:competence protein ComEC
MKLVVRTLIGMLAAMALLVWVAARQAPDGRLHIYLLDVASGQGIIVRSPSGRVMLIDGGPDASDILASLGKRLPFWQRSVYVVLPTHQGTNAMVPAIAVAERYQISNALMPPAAPYRTRAARRWEETLRAHGTIPMDARSGSSLDLGDGVIVTMLDDAGGRLSVLIEHGTTSVLLPGSDDLPPSSAMATVVALPAKQIAVQEHEATTFVLFDGHATSTVQSQTDDRIIRTSDHGVIEIISNGAEVQVRMAH